MVVGLPVVALLANVPWSRFAALMVAPSSLTALCLILGVPLATVLARGRGRLRSLVRMLVLLPLVLPPVVGGLALLYTVSDRGLLGPLVRAAGVEVAFTWVAVVLAQTFVAMPFLVLSVESAMRGVGDDHEHVACADGAQPSKVWTRVTLPLIRPALVTGTVLAFARALGEFGATATVAGSIPGATRTLPLEIYFQRDHDPEAAVALAVLLIVIAVIIMVATRRSMTTVP